RVSELERERDRQEVDRVFDREVRDDLAALREGLRISAKEAVFSKEMLTAIVAGVGTFAATVLRATVPMPEAVTLGGGSVTIGGLLGVNTKSSKARRDLIAKHPMAYLYEARGGLRL